MENHYLENGLLLIEEFVIQVQKCIGTMIGEEIDQEEYSLAFK